ncbi:hypothetical protein BH11PLA2_BH11PLA2_12230 [soil metagenome]
MAEIVVRCTSCDSLARVPASAMGHSAVCPTCGVSFPVQTAMAAIARSATPQVPTVYPAGHADRTEPSTGVLYGLALSAFLLPLVWLLLPTLGAKPAVFTLGLPLSLAFCAAGLGVGVTLADQWSFRTRVKGLLALIACTWALGSLFYFLKTEWVEAARRDLGLPSGPWHICQSPQHDFKAEMPVWPRPSTIEVIDGWQLNGYRGGDVKDQAYAVGEGKPRIAVQAVNDDQFFDAAKAGAATLANGTLVSERRVLQQGLVGREFVFKLADNATNRMVRVFRISTKKSGTKVVVAMAEGAFLPPDARDVIRFFDSLVLLNMIPK